MRRADDHSDGCARAAPAGHDFTRYLKYRLKVVVRRGDLVDDAELAGGRQFGQPRIEDVRAAGFDDDRVVLELQAEHVVVGRGTRVRARASAPL